jgi:hypothetical protein
MDNRLGITINGSEQGEGDLSCINRTTAARIAIDPMLKTLKVGGGSK